MKLGIVYAGQGSQKVGMGQDFYEKYDLFKETIDNATDTVKAVTDMDVAELSFNGPEEKLSQTKYTQPAMVAFAIGVTKLLHERGIKADYTLGLSLGEYSALYESEAIDEKQVLDLIAKRGLFMTEASEGLEVKMAAVLGAERQTVLDACDRVNSELDGKLTVQAANFNCPGQIVISGDAQAVDQASAYLKEAGAKRILPLKVSGPFHTKLMKPAGDKLKEEFKTVDFKQERSKVIFNCLGRERKQEETIPALLEKQVQTSVYLEDSIRYMVGEGVDTIIEIGPGKAISKFIAKTVDDVKVYSIDTVEDFEATVKELGA
ncbi:[acyl-carrier-protein] S-malonyltransferase [Pseudobutyrivibrio sp. NOR37]|uniref:Malonyl CoA-acyl carrier protein transacylase n=2 Tax=Pseudobutyrivibrio TaxID=46205 RepID=A0A2G3E7R1_9FIRM|nr:MULTISPECIES: ACP S-malonyltransferase [Pseudobutyrivibrio]NEX00322.1 ACP S-malonyltransferase [Pseudobutyrivibrio xylanivorans]PHU39316.1 [acyl-carrier-protein] S-malonyltransferase [Pseudobutyrivibrio ruminis]SFR84063.1 [acyl-carrier-protein] S-malonyltransferase [Pseudobutyrivibrio sp. NOR37]